MQGHEDAVYAIAFRPDGRQLASASFDHTIKVWDVASGVMVRTFRGHEDKVLTLAYSPDGKWLASAGQDETIRLWSVDGTDCKCLETSETCVHGLAFSPDGSQLLSCGASGKIDIWSVGIGRRERSLTPKQGPLYAIAMSPDGKCFAAAGLDGVVRVYDRRDGQVVQRSFDGHHDAVYSLAFSPDGATLASGSGDQTVRRQWRRGCGTRKLACLEGHRDSIYQVAFSSDGRRLVSAGTEGQIVVWNTETGAALHSHRFPCKTLCAAFAPDGRRIGAGTGKSLCYLMELPGHVRFDETLAASRLKR